MGSDGKGRTDDVKLTMLCKDENSLKNGCPSVYVTDSGEVVVQGLTLDDAESVQLENVLPGEGAVRISADLLIRAATSAGVLVMAGNEQYRARAGQVR